MDAELTPGSVLAEYRVLALIGRGGQGVVYRAQHLHLEREVALKVLPPEFAGDPEFRARFLREARLAASLEDPAILPIYDAGEADGVLFLAMRLVRGNDLARLIAQEGGLLPDRAISILSRVASALDHAHARGLVHRDVKPSNVLLEWDPDRREERVFLADFGLTKRLGGEAGGIVTRSGIFVGTPAYAAPEQIEGKEVDGRADQYALAAMLFQALTGQLPFTRDSEAGTLVAHMVDPRPSASTSRPSLPSALDAVLAKGMAISRDDRYPTCTMLVEAVQAALAGEPVTATVLGRPAPPVPLPAPPAEPPRRRRGLLIGIVAGLVVLAGLAALLLVPTGQERTGVDVGGTGGVGPTTPSPSSSPSSTTSASPSGSSSASPSASASSPGPGEIGLGGSVTRQFDGPNPEFPSGAGQLGGCQTLEDAPVIVGDGEGNEVARTTTSSATDGDARGANTQSACTVTFAVGVPDLPVYEVTVAGLEPVKRTKAQLEGTGFDIAQTVRINGIPPFGFGDVETVTKLVRRDANRQGLGEIVGVDEPTFFVAESDAACPSHEEAVAFVRFRASADAPVNSGAWFLCRVVDEQTRLFIRWRIKEGPIFGE